MDWIKVRDKISDFTGKYRFVLLILAIGIALMLIPSKNEQQQIETASQEVTEYVDTTTQLQQILSKISGAGRVEVMLTVASGERTVYQYDDDFSGGETGSTRRDTVIVTDAQRAQTGLVQQIIPPVYQGAIIVCQGADSASVRLSIIEAVSKVTGLGTDRISVLKMK